MNPETVAARTLPTAMRSPTSGAFQPATKLQGDDSLWARLFRPFTAPSAMVHRFLPKLKAGRLLLEIGAVPEWKHFEVVLAGSSIADLGLYYYASKTDSTPVGCVALHSAHVDLLEEVVMVVTQDKTWFFCAEHGRDAADWAEAICASIEKVSQSVLLGQSSVTGSSTGSSKRRRLRSQASFITLREIQSREHKARVDEFLEVFVRSTAEDMRLQAMEGAFSWSCMRNLAWKLWLDVVPMDVPFGRWVPIVQAKRRQYESLRNCHALFRDFLQGDQNDEAFIHACETSDDNLLYGIFKDVRRTRGAMDFFRNPSLQCLLIRVLYTYSLAHPEVSYNQGMGELLATLVYLLHIEQWPASSGRASYHGSTPMGRSISSASLTASSSTGSFVTITPNASVERFSESDSDDASYVYVDSFIDIEDDTAYMDRDRLLGSTPFCGGGGKYLEEAAEEIVHEMTDPAFLEHDAYLLLEEIMERMAGAYCPELTPSAPTVSSSSAPSDRKRNSLTATNSTASVLAMLATEAAASPLYDQMNSIHNHILSRCDPPTARHLSKLGVEPQMFLLRWVRVLMSREFEMAQVWQVWDSIFALTPSDFSFINLLCVAAVREFRDEILAAEDATAVLLCLRDLSEKVDADRLVENARELYDALLIAAAVEAADASAAV